MRFRLVAAPVAAALLASSSLAAAAPLSPVASLSPVRAIAATEEASELAGAGTAVNMLIAAAVFALLIFGIDALIGGEPRFPPPPVSP